MSSISAAGESAFTQVCPISLLPSEIISSCQEWQESETAQYNCTNDAYLQSFTPGKYAGVSANYLSFNTAQATPHFVARAKLFEACTGGKINFAEAMDIAEDPIKDIGSASAIGSELHDAYLMIYSFTSEASSLGLFETLNDRISETNALLRYEDIFPKVRSMGEYRKDGKTNIDLLMADGDFFVPVVRIDLLERDGLPLPHTWDDLIDIAKRYDGADLNDNGVADGHGFCIYPRTGSGFNDAWIPELMYSTWATTDQTLGIQEGFFFDTETFEPRISKGFERAMNVWKELWPTTADGCTTPAFVNGQCAIGLAPPGCWKGTFVNSDEGGVAWRNITGDGKGDGKVLRDDNGNKLWQPTMKDGSYAEPYRMQPFGSLDVINKDTNTQNFGEFVPCNPKTCPKAQRIKASSDLAADDRARVLVDSPHVGKLINRVPFYWSGGYGTAIRKSAEPKAKDLMYDFFLYVNTPITSIDDVVLPSWLDSWRYSQLSSYTNFKRGGWSFDSWNEHQKVMNWALGSEVNSALTLQLPGVLLYSRDVMLPNFQKFVSNEIGMEAMKENVINGWNDATTTYGKLSQLDNYRAALGLDALSTVQKCRLHREDMDFNDPATCKEAEDNSTLVIIVLCSILGAAVLLAVFYFSYKQYKSYKAIKKAHEEHMEKTLNEATRCLRSLEYPLHLLRGDEFISEETLTRHEVMRNTHRLVVLDNIADVDAFVQAGKQIVFFSHQWTSFTKPDPTNHQFKHMVHAVKELAKRNGWDDFRDVFVWVDYSCIPQANASVQNLAIRSLAVYASSATYFVIVAPETQHDDLDHVCDLDTYQRRMWCRAEQVCYSMRNGTGGMFLAGSKPGGGGHFDFTPVKSGFFLESLHVFNGELTCCRFEHKGMEACDRQSLVVPILGLYGELFRAAYDGIKDGSADTQTVEAFLNEIEKHQETVFPRTFNRVMWRKNKRLVEEVLLFGDLIDRMRAKIKRGPCSFQWTGAEPSLR
mmetsp:Transcript_5419/g.7092  ORF Transcript_5419/g.7092 Transcript_5419/m.7092 type:complete len:986 (+) Transcript_5419:173-3130(+)